MPNYLLHQTGGGLPIGVYTDQADYYDPEYEQLRDEGRELVYSKLPTTSWENFIERLADTLPSKTMRWDTYYDASQDLPSVLRHAQRDTETVGEEDSE